MESDNGRYRAKVTCKYVESGTPEKAAETPLKSEDPPNVAEGNRKMHDFVAEK